MFFFCRSCSVIRHLSHSSGWWISTCSVEKPGFLHSHWLCGGMETIVKNRPLFHPIWINRQKQDKPWNNRCVFLVLVWQILWSMSFLFHSVLYGFPNLVFILQPENPILYSLLFHVPAHSVGAYGCWYTLTSWLSSIGSFEPYKPYGISVYPRFKDGIGLPQTVNAYLRQKGKSLKGCERDELPQLCEKRVASLYKKKKKILCNPSESADTWWNNALLWIRWIIIVAGQTRN